MEVKIVSCSNEKFWYKDQVGETFTVGDSISPLFYRVVEDDKKRNGIRQIRRKDCQEVKTQTKED